MKLSHFLIITIALAFPAAAAAQDAAAILKSADQFRSAWSSFVVKTRIINFKNGQKVDEGDFEVMFKGLDKSLVRFLKADQKGQFLLMLEEKMWLYMPKTQRPIRVTPLQRLMGDASNGDVARSNYSRDYQPILKGEEEFAGKACYKLELSATNEAATYQRAELWVDKKNQRPIKAELYLASGKHFKSITYDEYDIIDGRPLLMKMTLYDRLRADRYTVMEFSGYAQQEIPDKFFNVNFLPKLK
jgi:outer membrane lipoprotein-sorting protein